MSLHTPSGRFDAPECREDVAVHLGWKGEEIETEVLWSSSGEKWRRLVSRIKKGEICSASGRTKLTERKRTHKKRICLENWWTRALYAKRNFLNTVMRKGLTTCPPARG